MNGYSHHAKEVLQTEAQGLLDLAQSLDSYLFDCAVDLILHCQGRLVVTGMGKSGHIGSKIAATLASTGTPAFFVHPAEAAHGDLGMILSNDVILALSHSGESDELRSILPALKRKKCKIIAITGRAQSTLAQNADILLHTQVHQEACPLGLAPTTSTTVVLALGDALAIALLHARNFTPDDFALSHPAGRLGKQLLVRVGDIMHSNENLPSVAPNASLREAIVEISSHGLGMVVITQNNHLMGIFTDGDLRRLFQKNIPLDSINIGDVMTVHPTVISQQSLAVEAVNLMQQKHINGLVVVDNNQQVQGVLNMHDLLQAGVL